MALLVRLELHDLPTDAGERAAIYERVHEGLKANGFERCVKDEHGARVHLPDATYVYPKPNTDKKGVGKLAVAIAWKKLGEKFKKSPGVVVTNWDDDAYTDNLLPCPEV